MMKRFYFDFVAAPPHLPWLRMGLLVVGLSAAAFIGVYYQLALRPQVQGARDSLRAEMAKLGAPTPTSTMKPALLSQAWQNARQASVQLNLPWQHLFVEIGKASGSGDVALMSIEPDASKGHVVLVAEARNLDAMLGFVADLQKSPEFSEVVLQSHTVTRNVPEKPVRFRLSATWRTTE